MQQYLGNPIAGGIAVGVMHTCQRHKSSVCQKQIDDPKAELTRLGMAYGKSVEELHGLFEKSVGEMGRENALIFDIQAMMLEDLDYREWVAKLIEERRVNAEYAITAAGEHFSKLFSESDNPYIKERSADVKDVSERLVRVLGGQKEVRLELEQPSIVAAEELSPSETVRIERKNLLAFVTTKGSASSHAAILARAMGIPALGEIDVREEWNGQLAVVDGYEGTLYIDPDEQTLTEKRAKLAEETRRHQQLKQLKGKETVTLDGRRIELCANIASVADAELALQNDAGGIGLFRSEFLYLERENAPSEEEQLQAYRSVIEQMNGRRVVIRTLDIGADKQVGYLALPREENPALGYRAIRVCFNRPELFRIQLRALLRASAFGNLAVMYPMITSVWEVDKIKQLVEELRAELTEQGHTIGSFTQGIMIETPASVMISRELADEVDFFSIGTNDLTQYTLAVDRQNPGLGTFYDPRHPALLRMIEMTVKNGHAGGCWVGICGELAADEAMTETFLRMGVDELSVSPPFVLPLRRKICELSVT